MEFKAGITDAPVQSLKDDRFSIASYVESLSEFILECETPMTIAIQGDWGCGKTSFMNLIDGQIKDKAKTVSFNTWEYSQFNLGEQLAISLMSRLFEELTEGTNKTNELKTLIGKLTRGAGSTFVRMFKKAVNDASLGVLEFENLDNGENKEFIDPQTLVSLKKEFQLAVNSAARILPNSNRVVIFVDDLDRLQPEKAVEMMEVMKVFLNCDNCVFVMAIDYAVVSMGITKKYGATVDSMKARSFFDKIIQMPFQVPVTHYTVDSYLKELLEKIFGTSFFEKEEDLTDFNDMINCTIGKNPRSIKRAINVFFLLNKVAEKKKVYKNDDIKIKKDQQKLLFVILTIQLTYEKLYLYIVENTDKISADFFENLKIVTSDEDANEHTADWDIDELKADSFDNANIAVDVFERVCNSLNQNAGTKDYAAVKELLELSAITSTGGDGKSPVTVRRGFTAEEIIGKVGCFDTTIEVYKHIEKHMADKWRAEPSGNMGSGSITFYIDNSNGKRKQFAETKLNKGSVICYFHMYGSNIKKAETVLLAAGYDKDKMMTKYSSHMVFYTKINNIADYKKFIETGCGDLSYECCYKGIK